MQQSSNPGIKWGIVSGLVLILLNVISWVAGSDVLFAWWNGVCQLVLFIVFGVLAGKERKKQIGGYIGFKELIKPVFTTFVIGLLMVSVYQFILYKLIDPHLSETLKEHTLGMTERILTRMKAPQEEIDKQLDSINATDFSVTIAKSLMDYLKSVTFYFAISAIISLILRKKAPEQQHI
ncbi:DUF4199 domain-containing protein [Chitinophaga sp. HK235]|uniref:DUF4199 domain-containing protein n=1 Tax=Chitinophaga sp. HK235 TaxID=2952571 RepID=UPI001BAB0E65|nr:DUF4199 domain-containing protein [Chitinophaga sp. HK235]